MRPMNQIQQRLAVEPELRLRDVSNEFGTRFSSWIQKLLSGFVGTKMIFILRRQESRLMMIEPPGQLLRW